MGSQNRKSRLDQTVDEPRGSRMLEMLNAVVDRRLYGSSFFLRSGPLLALGFIIQFLIYSLLSWVALMIYVALFFLIVLLSGLGSKNYAKEVPNIGYFRGLLFLIASVLASPVPFVLGLENTPYGFFRFFLTLSLSYMALTAAIIEVTIGGQRASLRESIPLKDDFFEKQKRVWREKLEGFPNSEAIMSSLDDGQFVASLFDRGSFSLAVLWSCNMMEKVIDSVAEGIISQNTERKALFRKDNNERRGYPKQLENLGLELQAKRGSHDLKTEILWHKVRRDIAHYNKKPSFHETYGALTMLVLFIEEMPRTLQAWKQHL